MGGGYRDGQPLGHSGRQRISPANQSTSLGNELLLITFRLFSFSCFFLVWVDQRKLTNKHGRKEKKTHWGLLPAGIEAPGAELPAGVHAGASPSVCRPSITRDRLPRVYLMMWGFIYEVMADGWEGEGERLRQPEDVTLKYHQGDGCPHTQH